MTVEEWRRVPDCDHHYEVSSHGRVRSFAKDPAGRIMKQALNQRTGYMAVGLMRDGRQRVKPIHWWATLAFFGPREPGLVVRHLDGDPHNNHISNLAYGSYSENAQDMVLHLGAHPSTTRAAATTHCKKGHPFTDANTMLIKKKGGVEGRRCRVCYCEAMLGVAERNLAAALEAVAA